MAHPMPLRHSAEFLLEHALHLGGKLSMACLPQDFNLDGVVGFNVIFPRITAERYIQWKSYSEIEVKKHLKALDLQMEKGKVRRIVVRVLAATALLLLVLVVLTTIHV
jgi:hypothetical protein